MYFVILAGYCAQQASPPWRALYRIKVTLRPLFGLLFIVILGVLGSLDAKSFDAGSIHTIVNCSRFRTGLD